MSCPPPIHLSRCLAIVDNPLPLVFAGVARGADQDYLAEKILTLPGVKWSVMQDVADHFARKWTGYKRWEAGRIWRRSLESWSMIDGELLVSGVDVYSLPPDRALNVLLAIWRKSLSGDQKKWAQWVHEVQAPPPRAIKKAALAKPAAEKANKYLELMALQDNMDTAAPPTVSDSEIVYE